MLTSRLSASGFGAVKSIGIKQRLRQVRSWLPTQGNPQLGDKLKDLSKEERKAAKATDADRQARRLAKKKLRHAMKEEKGAVKLGPSRADRDKGKKLAGGKKSRVRSDKAYSKMKGTRQA